VVCDLHMPGGNGFEFMERLSQRGFTGGMVLMSRLVMREKFTAMYAERLDSVCAMHVREARDGDLLERGVVLIAPGGRHMQLSKTGSKYFAVVPDGALVNRHKPSVDVLFRSAAECAGDGILANILTGMGYDDARS
jgi:two-component system chemotaxis response regulator CheB